MKLLDLHEFHAEHGARFSEVNGFEVVAGYGDPHAEYRAITQSAGVLDMSSRSRLCLLGADRQKFLNGQVTNNVKDLAPGQGCYAALITAKGRLETDLYIFVLPNEILLDFEPGLAPRIIARLEKYIIADDVQVVDAAPHYGLLSVQGPAAKATFQNLGLPAPVPESAYATSTIVDPALGEIYFARNDRVGSTGYDLFVPVASLGAAAEKLIAAAGQHNGSVCGWEALEVARIEAGIPRFGADMDETNLAPEAGIEQRAISYSKGCYIGQEVIARIRTYGQVAKSLRGLRLADDLAVLPAKGDKLFKDGKEVGYITSATRSPALKAPIALGYVRRESNQIGEELVLATSAGTTRATVAELPFVPTC